MDWHKNVGGNFRRILYLPHVDACAVLSKIDSYPFLTEPIKWLNETFPGFIHKCPYAVN